MASTGVFIFNSILFGIALAMDAFSISIACGLHDPEMSAAEAVKAPAVFGFFQILMPLAGWFCVRKLVSVFTVLQKYLPWISFVVLLLIGIGMIKEGLSSGPDPEEKKPGGPGSLFIQGIATSLDALSVGFTISGFRFRQALAESLIIGIVTFAICLGGISIGKKAGTRLGRRAPVLGGIILIAIGAEILIKGLVS